MQVYDILVVWDFSVGQVPSRVSGLSPSLLYHSTPEVTRKYRDPSPTGLKVVFTFFTLEFITWHDAAKQVEAASL